ncbi:hypothetical protein [Cupriavidus pauculus]|jgi:hypothetical protein|uniref:hypothetical protein n=1 Tax=Cupriavidus pauculus TaxID=82633 RepID=UPI00337B90DC
MYQRVRLRKHGQSQASFLDCAVARPLDADIFAMATGRQASTYARKCDARHRASRMDRHQQGNNLNYSTTPFTVSVYPIQQEPGLWFANYMISEYSDGAERIVANVSMRHATFGTEAKARQAARHAGESAIARMRPRPFSYQQSATPAASHRGIL